MSQVPLLRRLPAEHERLWQAARSQAIPRVRGHLARGVAANTILVVVADSYSLIGRAIHPVPRRLLKAGSTGTANPVVRVFVEDLGAPADAFCSAVFTYMAGLEPESCGLLVVDRGGPVLSALAVVPAQRCRRGNREATSEGAR